MPWKCGIVSICMALLVGTPATSFAGGFEIPDNGTRAMGRGGAYAAAVDEPSAVYFNPAALSLIDGVAATVNANLWFYDSTFQRSPFTTELYAGREVTYSFEAVENYDSFFPAPMLFASYDFGLDDWGFGLGVYGPSAIGSRTFGGPDLEELSRVPVTDESTRDWGHGYLIERSDILLIFPSLAVAYDFGPVQLGLTLQLAYMSTFFISGADGGGSFYAADNADETPSIYSRTTLDMSTLAPTGIIGVRAQPIEELTLSLSYRPRIEFEADGTVAVEFPTSLADQLSLTDEAATLFMTLPDVIRFGVLWTFFSGDSEIADIELDLVFETWSLTEAFTVDVQGQLDVAMANQLRNLPQIVIPKNYDDTLSIRLGGDVHVTEDLILRAGVYYEGGVSDFFNQGTAPLGFTNIDFTPFQRTAISIGAGYTIEAWSIDLALMHVFSPEVVETNGQVPILFPLWICNDPQTTDDMEACDARESSPLHATNNGTFNVSYDLISIGFTLNYD